MSNTTTMIQREAFLNEILKERGADFHVEAVEVFKNNVLLSGFSLKNESHPIAPTVYMDDCLREKSDMELISYLCRVFEDCQATKFDVSTVLSKDFILSHVLPRLYADSNADGMRSHGLCFRPLQNTGMIVGWYLPVRNTSDACATINLTDHILNPAGLSIDDIMEHAISNLSKVSKIENLSVFLTDALGVDTDLGGDLYMVSNKDHLFGASAILCPCILNELTKRIGKRFYILPASIHEVICIAFQKDSADQLWHMVCDINATMVSDVDRLMDGVLMYDGRNLVLV